MKPFRDRYDPSAAAGVPAHITLLYPFKSPDEVDQAVIDDLRHCFRRFASFRFALAPIRRFPDAVLYLAPAPDEPFRQLTLAIWDRYLPMAAIGPTSFPTSRWHGSRTSSGLTASPMTSRRRRKDDCPLRRLPGTSR